MPPHSRAQRRRQATRQQRRPATPAPNVEAMGQAAVNALLEEIAGTPAPHVEYVFQPELVVRGSTAARVRPN